MDALIDSLYDAATDASLWPEALARVAALLNAQGAEIGHMDARNNNLSFLISHGYTYTPERIRRYEELMPEDPRLPAFLDSPFRPIHCRMIVNDEELRATRVYQDVLAPDGIEYTLGVSLVEDDETSSFFAAMLRPGDGAVRGCGVRVARGNWCRICGAPCASIGASRCSTSTACPPLLCWSKTGSHGASLRLHNCNTYIAI
jgi:hypothetical protein